MFLLLSHPHAQTDPHSLNCTDSVREHMVTCDDELSLPKFAKSARNEVEQGIFLT